MKPGSGATRTKTSVLVVSAAVVVIALMAMLLYRSAQTTTASLRTPTGLLVSQPAAGCPTVQDLGLSGENLSHFAYNTSAYGGYCGAVLYTTHDVTLSSAKAVVWAASYDVTLNGTPVDRGLIVSEGRDLSIKGATTSRTIQAGATSFVETYRVVPHALYVFGLPTQGIDQASAMLSLRDAFVGYYPLAATQLGFDLPVSRSITDALFSNPGMK